jgi:hypothetical protein
MTSPKARGLGADSEARAARKAVGYETRQVLPKIDNPPLVRFGRLTAFVSFWEIGSLDPGDP